MLPALLSTSYGLNATTSYHRDLTIQRHDCWTKHASHDWQYNSLGGNLAANDAINDCDVGHGLHVDMLIDMYVGMHVFTVVQELMHVDMPGHMPVDSPVIN